MKKTILSLLVAIIAFSVSALAQTSDYSSLIVGPWQNTDVNPPRFVDFKQNGTWNVHYVNGKPDVNGTWQINGNQLVRNYPDGSKRVSTILKIDKSLMTLRNINQTSTGPQVQDDHYKHLASIIAKP